MAHWSDRVETEARRVFKLLRRLLEGALEAGNRRRVIVRDKAGKTLGQTPLTYVVLGGLVVFFIGQLLLPLVLLGLVAAYALGYRAVIVPATPPS